MTWTTPKTGLVEKNGESLLSSVLWHSLCAYPTRSYLFVFYLSAIMISTFGSSAPTPALKELEMEFNVSPEIGSLTLTLFLIGYATGPILWGPGSELFGRRPVFLFSMACYILFQLGQALSRNIETFLITRLLSGIFAASMSNCAGMSTSTACNDLSGYWVRA